MLRLNKAGNKFIFVFHDIDKDGKRHFSSEHYSTKLDRFAEQIDFLKRNFRIVPLRSLLEDDFVSGANYASLTFDDGFYSVKEYAHPLLSGMGIPYTCFINKAACSLNRLWISDIVLGTFDRYALAAGLGHFCGQSVEQLKHSADFNNQLSAYYGTLPFEDYQVYLNEADIRSMIASGVAFQSHSSFHAVLSMCKPEVLRGDIAGNEAMLRSLNGIPSDMFALPFGKKEHYTDAVSDALRKENYRFMFTTNPVGFSGRPGFAVPRIGLLNQSATEIRFLINRTFLKKIDL
ncbi:polysaccharide deacetylase family protein [Rurimicrobium arvi]|uniref:NodB homology domain-containing protein n=1 Tax=Rurimicrobium arvi TaxID=2049916 RepID=A0ABP8MNN9_9BACT